MIDTDARIFGYEDDDFDEQAELEELYAYKHEDTYHECYNDDPAPNTRAF